MVAASWGARSPSSAHSAAAREPAGSRSATGVRGQPTQAPSRHRRDLLHGTVRTRRQRSQHRTTTGTPASFSTAATFDAATSSLPPPGFSNASTPPRPAARAARPVAGQCTMSVEMHQIWYGLGVLHMYRSYTRSWDTGGRELA